MMRSNPKREFIRHTVDVPFEITSVDGAPEQGTVLNVSFGGLAFTAASCPTIGTIIELRLPTVDPPFEARGQIAWCRPEKGAFLVGVEFLDASDAFRARMVQQVCSIERYRQETQEAEGRSMTTEEAAMEWIRKYAGVFPDVDIAHDDESAA
jgi:hypothetical protein